MPLAKEQASLSLVTVTSPARPVRKRTVICVMPRSETDCVQSIIHIHLSLLDLSKLYQLHTCRSTILQSFKGSIPHHVVWLAFNQLSNRQVVVQIHPQRQLSTYVAPPFFFSKWHRRYYILFVKYSYNHTNFYLAKILFILNCDL